MENKDIDDFMERVSKFNKEKRENSRMKPCYNLDCDDERCRCYDIEGNLHPELEKELQDESRLKILEVIEYIY